MVDKYLAKKKKNLLEYAKVLEDLITLEPNTLWKTKQDFSDYAKDAISNYVNTYYFDNNVHRDNSMQYSNDNINFILKSIIADFKQKDMASLLLEKKQEIFLLSVILVTASYVDMASNVVDGDYKDTKKKFKSLLLYLEKTNVLKVYVNNKRLVDLLFDKVKKNVSEEDKFFNSFKLDNFTNNYSLYLKEPMAYKVSYKYNVPGLEEYDSKLVKTIETKQTDKYLKVCYDLLAVYLLQELISNREVYSYLIPVSSTNIKNENNFAGLQNKQLQEHIKLLIDYSDREKYKEYTDKLQNNGFKVIYEFANDESVAEKTFLRNMEVIVTEKFIKNNEDKLASWKNQGIEFVIKKNEEEV